MISDDPGVCLFDGADGSLCTYRDVCGQRSGPEPCLGMAAWADLPPHVQAKYSYKRPENGTDAGNGTVK